MLTCSCKNCFFEITDYKCNKKKNDYHKFNKRKAGVLIIDKYDRLLLVQSRGHLFGIAKGTLEHHETFENGALRELKEETGIDLDVSQLEYEIRLNQKTCYYYVKLDREIYPKVQHQIEDNDANSVVLITLNCLIENIKKKKMKITHQTKKVLGKLYENIDFFEL